MKFLDKKLQDMDTMTQEKNDPNSNYETKPLLSICIPTYNRSQTLKICLQSILDQIKGYENDIEVIVSDNCSSDDTQELVKSMQKKGPIRYNRNDTNIGAGPNFLLLSNVLSQGEYCWLIGDDDFIRKESLPRLISTMKKHPNIDLFYTNGMHIDIDKILTSKNIFSSSQFSDNLKTDGYDFRDREMESIDDLIDPKIDRSFLGAIMYSIFRRKIWLGSSDKVEVSKNDFKNAMTTFPHAVILVDGMRGRKVFYFGNPLIVVGEGARLWRNEYPMVAHIRLLELLDIYEFLGINKKQIKKCRKSVLLYNASKIVYLSIKNDGLENQYVDYKKSINKYLGYWEFWISFPIDFVWRISKIIRGFKKKIHLLMSKID